MKRKIALIVVMSLIATGCGLDNKPRYVMGKQEQKYLTRTNVRTGETHVLRDGQWSKVIEPMEPSSKRDEPDGNPAETEPSRPFTIKTYPDFPSMIFGPERIGEFGEAKQDGK